MSATQFIYDRAGRARTTSIERDHTHRDETVVYPLCGHHGDAYSPDGWCEDCAPGVAPAFVSVEPCTVCGTPGGRLCPRHEARVNDEARAA